MSSTLDRIMKQLDDADSDNIKVASAPAPTPTTEEALLRTVRAVSTSTKTASQAQGSPVHDLEVMAKEAQAVEFDLMTKQSHFLGAALADGFMERFAQYDAALTQTGVKTASTVDPHTARAIAENAYAQARIDFEKNASDEYHRGYDDQMTAVHKIASDLHFSGQNLAAHIVQVARSESR